MTKSKWVRGSFDGKPFIAVKSGNLENECYNCQGTGLMLAMFKCPICNGDGQIQVKTETKEFELFIYAVNHGSLIYSYNYVILDRDQRIVQILPESIRNTFTDGAETPSGQLNFEIFTN